MALLTDIFTKDKKSARNARKNTRAVREVAQASTAPVTEMTGTARVPSAAPFALIRPHTTEKTALLADAGVYVFVVPENVNKQTVASSVEARYGVKVKHVRMSRTHEKMRRRGTVVGWKPGIKKAMVQLTAGSKIETL